ncbi:MAG: hypothetical protein EOM19_04600 [Candidatus Moranbacteria bacterium]|nr:hypothetical protein [Candidatus Moranbacteria bacterium]
MDAKEKITICASMSFWEDILQWKEHLEKNGYDVIQYPKQFSGEFLPNYKIEFTHHYKKMTESDSIIVLNMKKNETEGYIGAAVFAEISFAVGLNRTIRANNPLEIYCVHPFPKSLPHSEEMQHWVDLGWLKFWNKD